MLLKVILVSAAFAACQADVIVDPASSRDGSFNVYIAFTRWSDRDGTIFNTTLESIQESGLSADRNTTIIVHGHRGTGSTTLNPSVKDVLLRTEDVDVIIVDWSHYSLLSYSNAVAAVPSVGRHLGELLQQLVAAGVATLATIHLVGFNLGAHIVGYAGNTVNGEVARITGLDPSGDQWGTNSQRLSTAHAKYVEVIHTDGSGLFANGIGTPLGHTDFFPNGGTSQPGCFLSSECSHNRAWEIFAASIEYDHLLANSCTSLTEMRWNLCKGTTAPLGKNTLVKFVSGIFRVNTKAIYPFLR